MNQQINARQKIRRTLQNNTKQIWCSYCWRRPLECTSTKFSFLSFSLFYDKVQRIWRIWVCWDLLAHSIQNIRNDFARAMVMTMKRRTCWKFTKVYGMANWTDIDFWLSFFGSDHLRVCQKLHDLLLASVLFLWS